MFRALSSIRIVALGLTLATSAAYADEDQNQAQSADQAVAEAVFVSDRYRETRVEQQESLDGDISAMIESEVMLDLTTRLTAIAPQS